MPAADASSTAPTLTAEATVDALEQSAVVRWWQTTSLLEVAGPDAPSLLDGLCTQAVERLEPGHAKLGLFLDTKAKIIAPVLLHRVDDATWTDPRAGTIEPETPRFLLETLPELVEPLRTHLTRYRLRARATIEPSTLATIAVAGSAVDADGLPPVDGSWTRLQGPPWPTWTLLADADTCRLLVRELLPAAGIGLADPDAFEATRIESGTASLHDLLPGRMPAEVGGMAQAVALDVGCYLGQEPVARLHYRGRANRTLRRVVARELIGVAASETGDADEPLQLHVAGSESPSRSVGRLTTWSSRPDGSTIGLAVLRREVEAGMPLTLGSSAQTLVALDDAPT